MTSVVQISGHSFITLVGGSNSTTVPIILRAIFKELDSGISVTDYEVNEGGRWNQHRLATGILSLFIYTVPAQYLCVVLSEFFKKLEETEDDAVTRVLADTIAELLKSNRSPLGYSGLELARNLLKLLRKQRPEATGDPRVSISVAKVRPARTIYFICNAFVALLRNANFALQKYEIIESLIAKAFFRDSKASLVENTDAFDHLRISVPSLGPSSMGNKIHNHDDDRHSMGTVTLDSREELHFRSVVWGILFALTDEGSSPSVLRLAFVEVHVKLFDMLFRMIRVLDEEFVLNTLVFWRQLLIHGLPIAPTRRFSEYQINSSKQIPTLGRPSQIILAKTRLSLAYLATTMDLNLDLLHFTAILSLTKSILRECDIQQLSIFLVFLRWLLTHFVEQGGLPTEEILLITFFALQVYQELASCLLKIQNHGESDNHSVLRKMIDRCINGLMHSGVTKVEMDDVLNQSSRPVLRDLPDLSKVTPSIGKLISAFNTSSPLPATLEVYRPSFDQDFICSHSVTNSKSHEKSSIFPPTRSLVFSSPNDGAEPTETLPSYHATGTGKFSRLSRLSGPASVITAPAFYQTDSSTGAGLFPTRTLTVSTSSLAAHSDAQSVHSSTLTSTNVDPLEEQFDQLTVKLKEKREKDKTRSLFFLKKK